MRMKIKKLKEGAHLPQRATEGSAGIDLCALCEEDIVLAAGQRALVPTGLAIELPGAQYVALVFARSGLALREGLAMANGVGVIDSDYRGEVAVPVINQSDKEIHIANGQRIAQMLVMPVELPQLVLVDELSDTERGEGGFGSTGKG
ncbi:MAG: dUTP diphosphatase [Oscillospiraceae bacterium]